MTASPDVQYRSAGADDVPAMAECRLTDPDAGAADQRMTAYFNGEHHPHEALAPRIGFVALAGDRVVGYIAGHRTMRHGCAGEVQYLFVAPLFRRLGIATQLLVRLARWFEEQDARKVCVNVSPDNPAAKPFYENAGASPIRKFWYGWEDISAIRA